METTPFAVMMGFSNGRGTLARATRKAGRGMPAFESRMALANSTSDFSLRRCTLANALNTRTVGGAK